SLQLRQEGEQQPDVRIFQKITQKRGDQICRRPSEQILRGALHIETGREIGYVIHKITFLSFMPYDFEFNWLSQSVHVIGWARRKLRGSLRPHLGFGLAR